TCPLSQVGPTVRAECGPTELESSSRRSTSHMKIESTDQDIRNLLSSGYYLIPRFQRPYSWTRENIQEFWDDIVRDRPIDYFIGSMVAFKEGNQRYGVVDGQQRLTTREDGEERRFAGAGLGGIVPGGFLGPTGVAITPDGTRAYVAVSLPTASR